MWLLLLIALRFAGRLAQSRRLEADQKGTSSEEEPPDYRALQLFALSKWIGSLSYTLLFEGILPIPLGVEGMHTAYNIVFWAMYIASAVCVFYVMGAILRKGLSPLPGLSAAAWTVFRWAGVLALMIALTAHLPIFGVHDMNRWLNEMSVSFLLCICLFEIFLLVLLLTQLRRLGMFIMSRPVGLALGLAVLGVLDLAQGVTFSAPANIAMWVNLSQEAGVVVVVSMWAFYILRREPQRLRHSLSPASRLSKWDDIAKRIGVAHREPEHVPFITTVESVVDSILERHKAS